MGNQLATRRGVVISIVYGNRCGATRPNLATIRPFKTAEGTQPAEFVASTVKAYRAGDHVVARQNGVNWEV